MHSNYASAVLSEYVFLSHNVRRVGKYPLIARCAKDMAKKLPGRDESYYFNLCDDLVKTVYAALTPPAQPGPYWAPGH